MGSISGIGALTLYANEPAELAGWYAKNLGFVFEANRADNSHYGQITDADTGTVIFLAILPSKQELPYGNRGFMVNYKVQRFAEFVTQLQKKGVRLDAQRGDGESRFATISDPEGNVIELWSGV